MQQQQPQQQGSGTGSSHFGSSSFWFKQSGSELAGNFRPIAWHILSRGIFAPSHGTSIYKYKMKGHSRRGPPAKSTVGIRMDRQIARGVSRALDATPHSQNKVISLSASQIRVPPMKTSSPSSSTSSTSSILTMTGYSGAAHEDSIVTIIHPRILHGYLSHSCSNLRRWP